MVVESVNPVTLAARGRGDRVTRETRLGEVRSHERKSRLRVVRRREQGRRKPVYRMAAFAGAAIGPGGKLAGVGIGVAVGAAFVRQWLLLDARHVALVTNEPHVETDERETGLVVIELRRGDVVPRVRVVALHARRSVVASVRVVVTGRAVFE
jgi:hypothetical protein